MRIEDIKKRYRDKWVLIEVLKEGPKNQPLEGKVLAQSKNREEIYDLLLKKAKKGKHLATLFTGKVLKEDYAAAF